MADGDAGYSEFWTADAVNQLLIGLGVDPAAVHYRVFCQRWQDEVRIIEAVDDVQQGALRPEPDPPLPREGFDPKVSWHSDSDM